MFYTWQVARIFAIAGADEASHAVFTFLHNYLSDVDAEGEFFYEQRTIE